MEKQVQEPGPAYALEPSSMSEESAAAETSMFAPFGIAEIQALPWFPRLYEFNFLPSRLLHPSWHDDYAPQACISALRVALDDETALHRHWSAYLLRTLRLEDRMVWRIDEPVLPWVLMPDDGFYCLIDRVGLTLGSAAIRQAIRREDVLALRELFSADSLRFAYSQSVSIHSPLDRGQLLALGPVPQVLRELGAAAILFAVESQDSGIYDRLRLRLPKPLLNTCESAAASLGGEAMRRLVMRIAKDMDPEWHSYCTTVH